MTMQNALANDLPYDLCQKYAIVKLVYYKDL